jgi:hypothetical protein
MNIYQRIAGVFAAVAFLAAAIWMTCKSVFSEGVVIFDSIVVIAAAICGWIAWRGGLRESQPKGRWVILLVKTVLVVIIFLLVALFLLFWMYFNGIGQHDKGH